MTVLVLGMILFIGAHSVRIVADNWRDRVIVRLGEQRWKALYSLASGVGLALIIWGFGIARQTPVVLWARPSWAAHAGGALMLPAIILILGPYLGRSHINTAVRHPMLCGTVLFGVAHLLANNTLADVVLFGGFAAWAATDLASALGRDRRQGRIMPAPVMSHTLRQLGVGTAVWAAFGMYLHRLLFGVSPFGF
jgi:uncharacterized membrane protein